MEPEKIVDISYTQLQALMCVNFTVFVLNSHLYLMSFLQKLNVRAQSKTFQSTFSLFRES